MPTDRPLTLRCFGLAALLASLPTSLPAQSTSNKPVPPRLSVLMGLTNDWQQQAQATRARRDTLLRWQTEAELPASDPFNAFNTLVTVVQDVSRAVDQAPAAADPHRNTEGEAVPLPEHTRPADYATSGFATAASGYSHAKFAADMLAAPARAGLAAASRPDWFGDTVTRASPAPAAIADRAPQNFAVPAWTAASGASFVSTAYANLGFSSGATVGSPPAAPSPLPAAINAQSVIYGWGNNNNGQQGSTTASGVTTGITSPTQITSVGSGVSAVAAGGAFSLYLRGGNVYAAGNNFYGQLGNANNVGSSTAVNSTPTLVSALPSGATTLIAGGTNFSLAVANGTLYAWGFNSSGQTGNGPTLGTSNANPTPAAVSGMPSGVTTIAAGASHTLALANGTLYAFGLNNNGQLGNTTNNGANNTANSTPNPTPTVVNGVPSGITAIAAGSAHSLALTGGNVYAWGYNQFGQLGSTTNNQAGTNVATPTPTQVAGLPSGQVTAIAAGGNFSLALANGSVFSWGFNGVGQLGNGTTSNTTVANPTPYQVQFNGTSLSGIVALAANNASSYALASDGSLYVWGNNVNGQLGLGTTTAQYTTPQHLLPPSGQYYQAIESDGGGNFVLAIVGDSAVPEPSTWAGGALLLLGAGWTLRRQTRWARSAS